MNHPQRPEELTASDLAYYLFGNPMIAADKGIIGRMEQRVDRLTKLAWAILLMLLTAVIALIANLTLILIQKPIH